MPDPLRRVSKGDPISAAAWNAILDVARSRREAARRFGFRPGEVPLSHQRTVIPIRNDSGYDVGRYGVLGITGGFPTPTENANGFKAGPILTGVRPEVGTHDGNFAILLEPIEDGKIGQACIAGVTVAAVDVTDADHARADIKDDDYDSLESGSAGTADILWKESGTGVKWALIRFAGGSGQSDFAWGIVQAGFTNGIGTSSRTVTVKLCRADGTNPEAGSTSVKTPLRMTKYTALFTGDIVALHWDPDLGFWQITSDCFDDSWGTVKGWDDAVATIPDGWTEFTAAQGRYLRGYDSADAAGFGVVTVGATGGSLGHTHCDHGSSQFDWDTGTENSWYAFPETPGAVVSHMDPWLGIIFIKRTT